MLRSLDVETMKKCATESNHYGYILGGAKRYDLV
jgi:hypothetical protein